jgi:hypothetical protein
MDAGTAGVLGGLAGGFVGAGGTYLGARLTAIRQQQARLDQLVAEVSGWVLRRVDEWDRPGWGFYARCVEIECNVRASDWQRQAAQNLKAATPASTPCWLRQQVASLQRSVPDPERLGPDSDSIY